MNEVLAQILSNTVNSIARFFEWIFRILRFLLFDLWKNIIVGAASWVMSLRFWTLISLIATVIGVCVFLVFYFTKGWSGVVAAWFRSAQGVEVSTLTLLAVLGLIYWKRPSWFTPIMLTAFLSLLLIFVFELNRSKIQREDQNHWAVFSIFVLPLLPVLFTLLEVKNKIAHAVATSLYLVLIAALMGTNPNTVFQPRLFTQGTIYIIAVMIFVALVTIGFNRDFLSQDWTTYLSRIGMLFVTCAALAMAVTLAIKFFATNPTWSVRYLIMLMILVVAGAIVVSAIWKRLPDRSYFAYFTKANLAIKTLLLLSCWTSDLMAMLVSEPKQTWALLAVEIVLIVWYIYSKTLFTTMREGKAGGPKGVMVRNEPLGLRYESVLPISTNFRYNYAISCWVYLNALPPSASPEATGFSNIISYGGRPTVSFNAASNTLRVTMRHPGGKKPQGLAKSIRSLAEFTGESMPSEPLEYSGPHDVLVTDIPDVALQKWIHFVFFYTSAGMLDIFINGVLYKSVAAIVTDESSGLTVGAHKGNPGKIANVMFFQGTNKVDDALFVGGDAMDAAKVHSLYNDFKGRDPPVVTRVFPVPPIFQDAAKEVSKTTTDVSRGVTAAKVATTGSLQTAFDPNQALAQQF